MHNSNKGFFSIPKKKPTKIFSNILLIVVILLIIHSVINGIIRTRNTEIVNSLLNIAEPIQETTSGEITMSSGVKIEKLATYSITGRVVSTHTFFNPINPMNRFSPRDISIVWGALSDPEVDKDIRWGRDRIALGPRFLAYVTNADAHRKYGDIDIMLSNNHMIPANKKIRRQLMAIKKKDFVRIEGYLVSASFNSSGQTETVRSSLSRTDTGAGACELIYVTKITWLRT